MKLNFLELIVNDILAAAKARESSDEVAAIHGVWMEIGRMLGKEIRRIREKERTDESLRSD